MFTQYLATMHPNMPVILIVLALPLLFLMRYTLFAGGALAVTTLFRKRLQSRRLQPQPFTKQQLLREAGFSVLSAFVFAAVGFIAFRINHQVGIFHLYRNIDDYGWLWFVCSIPAGLLVHDFYFYWAHRLMHLPGIYKHVHEVHHRSTNPSPLAAFAFHPFEAVVETLGFIVVILVLPMHVMAFLIVSTVMITYNVLGHLGYELYPSGLIRTPFKWIANTATSHNQHHRTYRYNFGLYTLIWDHLFGTVHPRYVDTFLAATQTPHHPISPKSEGLPL